MTLDSVEEGDHTTPKAKLEKAASALLTLPCTLGHGTLGTHLYHVHTWPRYTEATMLGGRGQPHREATRSPSRRQVGHQSIPGVRHVSQGDLR